MSMIYFMFQQIMLFTIPLTIMTLGDMFSEQSGMANIVLEGIMIMGAFAGTPSLSMTGGRMSGQMQLLLVILVSTVTGAVFVFFRVYASINIKTNQTTSEIVLSMLAPTFAIFVAKVIQGVQQIQFNSAFRIESVSLLDSIPFFGPLLFQNIYITTYLGVVTLILSTLVLYRIRSGLRLYSCSEHPQAADATGINVCRIQYAGVLISGVLGGLGGLMFVVPAPTNSNADVTGYGFLALAVPIFEQWKPVKVMWASLFFDLMKAMVVAHSGISFLATTGIPSYVCKMIPYVAALVALVFTPRSSRAPRTSSVPYDKGQR